MTYDAHFRHAQALDPSGLDTIAACLHAIRAAAKDCRNAGLPFESDPAVVLLARHLGSVAARTFPDGQALRGLCAEALAEVRSKLILVALARRGVAYDANAKRAFHAEARKALRLLADALGLAAGSFDIRICAGGPAVAGEVILHADRLYIKVSVGSFGSHDIMFRRCRDRSDYCGERNHWARIEDLLNPALLAARIARELGLELPEEESPRLVA
ncbi:MAG: hypothetical protein ACOYLK_14920 [Sphingomonas sp.]